MHNIRLSVMTLLLVSMPVVHGQTLIPRGALWLYWDSQSAPPSNWQSVGIDDSNWKTGRAELGYGDGDERSKVGTGNHVTTYFRHHFPYWRPAAGCGEVQRLRLQILRDDGAAVYLNGKRVLRTNLEKLPDGTIDPTDLAKSTVAGFPEENRFHDHEFDVACAGLIEGENVLAVEVHQASTTSSDLSFDLELSMATTARVTRGPYLQLVTPHSVIVRWETDVATRGYVRYAKHLENLATPPQSVQTPLPASASTRHEVHLQGLVPDTTYYYVVGMAEGPKSTDIAGLHPDFHFTTTARPIEHAKKTHVWILGDSGAQDIHAKSVKNAYLHYTDETRTDDDVWLMLGDNAYYHGTRDEFQAALFEMYPEELRQQALWSAIGNHDADTNPEPYFDAFNFPTRGEAGGVASGTEAYYSFRYNN